VTKKSPKINEVSTVLAADEVVLVPEMPVEEVLTVAPVESVGVSEVVEVKIVPVVPASVVLSVDVPVVPVVAGVYLQYASGTSRLAVYMQGESSVMLLRMAVSNPVQVTVILTERSLLYDGQCVPPVN